MMSSLLADSQPKQRICGSQRLRTNVIARRADPCDILRHLANPPLARCLRTRRSRQPCNANEGQPKMALRLTLPLVHARKENVASNTQQVASAHAESGMPAVDAYAPPLRRRAWQRTRPHAEPLRQGEQRANKDIGTTIMNSFIFGFFASCGGAAFGAVRNACCR